MQNNWPLKFQKLKIESFTQIKTNNQSKLKWSVSSNAIPETITKSTKNKTKTKQPKSPVWICTVNIFYLYVIQTKAALLCCVTARATTIKPTNIYQIYYFNFMSNFQAEYPKNPFRNGLQSMIIFIHAKYQITSAPYNNSNSKINTTHFELVNYSNNCNSHNFTGDEMWLFPICLAELNALDVLLMIGY